MTPALQSYIEGVVGGRFNVQVSTVAVGASSTKLVGPNFERMALAIINSGGVNGVILPDLSVTLTKGITLNANGGSMTLNAHDDLALVGWEWFAISSGGGTTFTIMEIVRYFPTQPGGS